MVTTKLVLELVDVGAVAHADLYRDQLERNFAQTISDVIIPFMRTGPGDHMSALIKIVHEAIELDKEISMHLPRYSWAFSPGPIELPFDFSLEQEGVMRLHPGEKAAEKLPSGTRTKVYLVIAPGVRSRGRPEDDPSTTFKEESWTIPMEVTCIKPRRQSKFTSSNGVQTRSRTRTRTFTPDDADSDTA